MVQTQIKRVVFNAFISLNLLVSGLQAVIVRQDCQATTSQALGFTSVVVPAAMLACTVEKLIRRATKKPSADLTGCPLAGVINKKILTVVSFRTMEVANFDETKVASAELGDRYAQVKDDGAENSVCTLQKVDIPVVAETGHCAGVRVGYFGLGIKGDEKSWLKFLISGQVYVEGVTPANILKTVAAACAIQAARPYLPSLPSISRK